MAEIIEFETDRLRLRQWLAKDREPFAALNADPRVMEFFPATLDRATSDAMAEYCERLIAERGWGFWAAEVKGSGHFIGFIRLHIPSSELPFSPCVEIGWRLAFRIGARASHRKLQVALFRSASNCLTYRKSCHLP
jgi:RimJ/RimL family protein N-acetyltransferase